MCLVFVDEILIWTSHLSIGMIESFVNSCGP